MSLQTVSIRIVSWNCRDGFAKKCDRLCTLEPDIAIVQECREPAMRQERLSDAAVLWHGAPGKRGLAVIGFGKWRVVPGAELYDDLQFFLPVRVLGAVAFNLLGLWTKPSLSGTSVARSYIGQFHLALERYSAFMEAGPTVVVGDLNSNAIWDRGQPWHYRGVVARLQQLGCVSAYHAYSGEEYGRETRNTYRHNTGKGYHIDHCFLPRAWITDETRFRIGSEEWLSQSDHMPLIADVSVVPPD